MMLLTFREFYNLWLNRDKPSAKYLLRQLDVSQAKMYEKFAQAKEFEVVEQNDEKVD